MGGNSYIPRAAGHSSSLNSAGATVKNQIVSTVEDGHLELQFGKSQHRERRVEFHQQRLFVCGDTLFRPKAVVCRVAVTAELSRSNAGHAI